MFLMEMIHQREKTNDADGKGDSCMSESLACQEGTGSSPRAVPVLRGYGAGRLADLARGDDETSS